MRRHGNDGLLDSIKMKILVGMGRISDSPLQLKHESALFLLRSTYGMPVILFRDGQVKTRFITRYIIYPLR